MIHIHNGDVVASMARRAGIPGEHIAYRESLIAGPVVPGSEWLENRARTLAAASGEDLLRVRTQLFEQEQALDAVRAKSEIVLWFEHDLYCLVHFIHLLQRFVRYPDVRLTYVWASSPLGLSEEADLVLQFESRTAATPALGGLAREIWQAYTASDPTALNRWLDRDVPELRFLREGLTLHASRFPSTRNGLGSIEQTILEQPAAGVFDFPSIFEAVNARGRFGFGDTEVFRIMRSLATRAIPLVTLVGELPKAMCAITPVGEKVLAGEVDELSLNDPDLWLGGAHLTKENVWRFDGRHLSRAAG